MRSLRAAIGLAVSLVMVAPMRDAVSAPTPRPTPGALEKPGRADLPRCDELRLTADEMAAAFRNHAAESGDVPEGQEAFDAIGDELGCQWPWSAADSRRGMMQLLEKAGGRPGSSR